MEAFGVEELVDGSDKTKTGDFSQQFQLEKYIITGTLIVEESKYTC